MAETKPRQMGNLQVIQEGMDASPAEGGEGYIGGNSNAGGIGLEIVQGKKGSVEDRKLWSTQSSGDEDSGAENISPSGSDPTDEMASYKHIQTDEGLPQTYRDSRGAGDAGPTGSDEPDQTGGVFGRKDGKGDTSYKTDQNIQDHPAPESGDESFSDMPQTEFTDVSEGGAPSFKHSRG